MAKYSLKSNKYQADHTAIVPAVIVIIMGIAFLALPYLVTPLQRLWGAVSISTAVTTELIYPLSGLDYNECIVIGTPPSLRFDTVLLRCRAGYQLQIGDPVWYQGSGIVDSSGTSGAGRYWVGTIESVTTDTATARLFTSYATAPFAVRFDGVAESFSGYPIGGGVIVAEVPSSVAVTENRLVRHAVTGQLLGRVHAVDRDQQTLIERIYIRLPFSFQRLTRLEVGN